LTRNNKLNYVFTSGCRQCSVQNRIYRRQLASLRFIGDRSYRYDSDVAEKEKNALNARVFVTWRLGLIAPEFLIKAE
jgi:hypothetical protein